MVCADSLCSRATRFQTGNALKGYLDLPGLRPTHGVLS